MELLSLGKKKALGDYGKVALQHDKVALIGAYKNAGEVFFKTAYSDKIGDKGFKLKEGRLEIKENFFTVRFAERSCGYPITGDSQHQIGQGFVQSDLIGSITDHGRTFRTRRSLTFLQMQTIL